MGASAGKLLVVNMLIMRNRPILSHQQQLDLCAEVTKDEMYKGLCSIGNDKAPGIDMYNAVFYKKGWPIIKWEVCIIVKELFAKGIMYKAINCTTLTLLPKVSNQTH